jgi:hypothetical protein
VAFPEMQAWQYPPRLWALEGYPGSGKSTFAAQMKAPLMVIDADHRFREVLSQVAGGVYELSKNPTDHIDSNRIAGILADKMPGTSVGTIIVDSLSAILEPLIVQAMMDKETGKVKNQMAAFRLKALAMRQLQDAVTRWGSDVLWIYHLRDVRDATGKEQVRTSVPDTELERLKRCLNLKLRIVEQEGKRVVQVVWARRGRTGMTLRDDSGNWAGMPAKIEAAVYGAPDYREEQAPCYADGSAIGNNPREIAAYQSYMAEEGKPPSSPAELRAWLKRQT